MPHLPTKPSWKMINERMFKKLAVKLNNFLGPLVIVAVFCLIFIVAHRAIFDLDIWLHLKTGEIIAKDKIIPSRDIFSFTIQGRPWVDHSWLFQLISYLVYSAWQADGLIFLECLIIVLAFLVLFLMGYRLTKSFLELSILLTLTAYASITRFNIRPDMFSLLFFAIYLYILKLDIGKRAIWLLVPIQALWVNFHGYFFLGPLLILFFLAAEFLKRNPKIFFWHWKEETLLSDAEYRRLKLLFLLSILACFLSPNGLKGASYPLFVFKEVLAGRTKIFMQSIIELKPTIGPGALISKFYYIMAILCFVLMAINFRRLKIVEIFLVLFFFPFSFSHRNIVFFLFISNMITVSYMGAPLKKVSKSVQLQDSFRQALYFSFRCLAALVFIAWLGKEINKILDNHYYDFKSKEFKSLLEGVDQRNYPEGAADFLLENSPHFNLLNDFNSGAYLIGRVYPKDKVFIDGRTELYGPEFFKEYMELEQGDIPTFEKIINKYNITGFLADIALNPPPNIAGYLYRSPQWKLVFFDEAAVIFLKDVPQNQELIRRYKVDFNKYTVPKVDLKDLRIKQIYPAPFIKRASLFNLFKEDELLNLECKEALRIMPNCAEAFHYLGKMYLRKNLYQEALENLHSSLVLLPNNTDALVDLAVCLNGLKDAELSIKALKKAIEIDSSYAPAYFNLGLAYLAKNKEAEAIWALNKAIKQEPENPAYHFELGEAFLQKGKKLKNSSYMMKAKLELNKALELKSRFQTSELTNKEIEDKLKEAASK